MYRDFNTNNGRRGGYSRNGNFDNNNRPYSNYSRPYEINQPVRHIATGTRLIVISYGREQIECRKPDLTAEYFYEYELEPIDDK